MVKVLIPFTEPAGAERAVRQLLDEPDCSNCQVELLAIVEPVEAASARSSVSPALAGELAREEGSVWIARIAPLLADAKVPYHGAIAVGHCANEVEAAMHRVDVDRVMLPAATPRWRERPCPVTLVP